MHWLKCIYSVGSDSCTSFIYGLHSAVVVAFVVVSLLFLYSHGCFKVYILKSHDIETE